MEKVNKVQVIPDLWKLKGEKRQKHIQKQPRSQRWSKHSEKIGKV